MTDEKRPNILIFVMDTQSVRNMTPYGFHKETTPNLQTIASEGIVYENHFVTAAWTVPSFASLFTGKYQSGHGAGASFNFLSREIPTLAELLSRTGYQTVALAEVSAASTGWVSHDETDLCRGFKEFIPIFRHGEEINAGSEAWPIFKYAEGEDSGSTRAIRLVEEWFENSYDPEKPFFMMIRCTDPHLTVWAPQPFRGKFLPEGVSDHEALEVNQDVYLQSMGLVPNRPGGYMNERDWEILKGLYDGETACLDHRMGQLFEYLTARQILDDTLLIITGDHGDLLDRDGFLGHEPLALFDDLLHTPLIVRCPGVVPEAKRVSHLVQICDWFPTILDLLELEETAIRREMQGVSLIPTWADKPVREFIIAEHQPLLLEAEWFVENDMDYRSWMQSLKTLRTLDWKYIWCSDGNDMIFDIRTDPGETNNLIATEKSRASAMRKKLEGFLLGIEQRDYGDKLARHYTPYIRHLKTWGYFRELRFPT